MNSSPLDSEVSSPINSSEIGMNSAIVHSNSNQDVLHRVQQDFENQLVQTYEELHSNGIDVATAEYEILCRLSQSGTGAIVVEEDTLNKYIIEGRLRRDEAVRALVIQRELDSLREKGFTLLDSMTELILRLSNKTMINATHTKTSGKSKKTVGLSAGQQVPPQKKKIIRELAGLCVMSKNKVRVHRRSEIDDPVTGAVVSGKEAFVHDGESPRPAKKLRKDGSIAGVSVDRETNERKRMRGKSTFKSAAKFN